MALPVKKFREIVFQLLYSRGFATEGEGTASMLMAEVRIARGAVRLCYERVKSIEAHLEEIDAKIEKVSIEYSFERISRVEKTVLRLGVYELLHDPAVPPLVAIAEAVRLTRKFGTCESAQFVNAILDAVYKSAPANQPLPQ